MGKTKNARIVGGIISSTAKQLSVYLELDPDLAKPVGERFLRLSKAQLNFIEFKITHDLLQNPDTDMIRRLMRDMRVADLPFDFDVTLVTSDDALTHHGRTSWTREMLFLPLGAFAADSIASIYLDIHNVMCYALTEERWEYLLRHMFLLPQHIHGNEDTHANHLGLAMYYLFDSDEEDTNSSIRFEIRRLFQVDLHTQNIVRLGHLNIYINRSR